MKFSERIKLAVAAFKGEGGVKLPAAGRSSDETLSGMLSSYLAGFSSVSPIIDTEMLKTLKHFWLYNPDFSQYIANIVNLGNPGHSLSVDASNDAAAEAAVNRLNESASRIYDNACGVDGLIDQYLTSVAWSGAISSEDVVNIGARRVEKVVLVPVEQIRFKYNKDLDKYEPYQRSTNLMRASSESGLIKLNPETYKYFALQTIENSPYAKPPATAAVEAILAGQVPIMDNIRWMAQKIGLMGFIDYKARRPTKRSGETDDEYLARCTQYVSDLNKALDGNLGKGMLVHLDDQTADHTPVTTGAAGVYELNRLSEEQVFSGMAAMPGFHGRTDSTTETFADVVYYLLTAQVANIQRIVKRRQEQTYRLDLRLGGIDVDGVSLSFNKAHSRNALQEAQTDQVRLGDVITKVEKGIISPDQGAQELGYDTWFDVELMAGAPAASAKLIARGFGAYDATKTSTKTLRVSFDKPRQKYIYQPEVIMLASGDEANGANETNTVVPFIKKKALA